MSLTIPGTWISVDDDVVVKADSRQEAKDLARAKMIKMILSKKNWKATITKTAPLGESLD